MDCTYAYLGGDATAARYRDLGYSFIACRYSIVAYVMTAKRGDVVICQGRGRSELDALEDCLDRLDGGAYRCECGDLVVGTLVLRINSGRHDVVTIAADGATCCSVGWGHTYEEAREAGQRWELEHALGSEAPASSRERDCREELAS